MNRRNFIQALLPLPVVATAAGVSLANQQTPQRVVAPFIVQDDDGNELIIESDGEGGFAITMPELHKNDKVMRIHKPKQETIHGPWSVMGVGQMTGLDITMPLRLKR